MKKIIAVDLGGTRFRAAVVSGEGVIFSRHAEPTPLSQSHPDQLVALVTDLAEMSGASHAVVGLPGRVDYERGELEYAPNLPEHWAGHLSAAELEQRVGLPVALANDADLAAVGEHRFGAGRGTSDMVYVTVSTGIGCGVILGGTLVHGRRSLAEVGHTTIDLGEGTWTLEEVASGTAMEKLAADVGVAASGADVAELVRLGSIDAIEVWDEVARLAGLGIANLAHLFSPQVIVVGGGVAASWDILLRPLQEAVAERGPRGLPEPIRIAAAALGDDAGLIGAAGWSEAFRDDRKVKT